MQELFNYYSLIDFFFLKLLILSLSAFTILLVKKDNQSIKKIEKEILIDNLKNIEHLKIEINKYLVYKNNVILLDQNNRKWCVINLQGDINKALILHDYDELDYFQCVKYNEQNHKEPLEVDNIQELDLNKKMTWTKITYLNNGLDIRCSNITKSEYNIIFDLSVKDVKVLKEFYYSLECIKANKKDTRKSICNDSDLEVLLNKIIQSKKCCEDYSSFKDA